MEVAKRAAVKPLAKAGTSEGIRSYEASSKAMYGAMPAATMQHSFDSQSKHGERSQMLMECCDKLTSAWQVALVI